MVVQEIRQAGEAVGQGGIDLHPHVGEVDPVVGLAGVDQVLLVTLHLQHPEGALVERAEDRVVDNDVGAGNFELEFDDGGAAGGDHGGLDILIHLTATLDVDLVELDRVGVGILFNVLGPDAVAGLAVEPGDDDGFVAAIAQLIDDPAKARRMGETGRRWIEQWASPASIGERYAELFRQLVER